MKNIIIVKLLRANNKKISLFVDGIKTSVMNRGCFEINGISLRKTIDELWFKDYKIIDFKQTDGIIKKLITPPSNENEKNDFFEKTSNQLHYLNSKYIKDWDEYDESNWISLNKKYNS